MSSIRLADFEKTIAGLMTRGDWPAAADAAAECRSAWPAAPTGWLLGSYIALILDDKQGALAHVDAYLKSNPHHIQCLLQKAECLLALGHRSDALTTADAAAMQAGRVSAALDAVGGFFVHAGAQERALAIYDRALEHAGDDPSLLAKRAVIHRFLGNFELASADYDRVVTIRPTDPEALKARAELRKQTPSHNSLDAMRAALQVVPRDSRDAATLHFGLAKSLEDMGDHEGSWEHLEAANAIEQARLTYDPAQDRAIVERIIAGFAMPEEVAADTTGQSPIFILGLPRSGTTLVDRILGSHSLIHSAGELPYLSEALGATMVNSRRGKPHGWLGFATALPDLAGEPIAREYLARAQAKRGDKPRFTDKQPTNFFYCALILRAFPKACIVNLRRHPLATCYAIYKTRFEGTYPFAYSLQNIADFYIGYDRLMAHWHRIMPGRILDLAYEDVVLAQESATRRLLDYVDVPFEDACLAFHANPAPIATASSVQARQPLFDSSVNQWRVHAARLDPVRAQLEAAGVNVPA